MDNKIKEEAEAVYFELVKSIDIDSSDSLIHKTKKYVQHLQKRDLPDYVIQALDKIPDMINKLNDESYPYNKKLLLASFEYLVDRWDVIPDTSANGLIDDSHVIELANLELSKLEEKQKRARKLKFNPDDILDKLNYSIKHLIELANDYSLYTVEERRLMMKMHNFNRSNFPISRKERVFMCVLIERYYDKFGLKHPCKTTACDDCYKLSSYFKEYVN